MDIRGDGTGSSDPIRPARRILESDLENNNRTGELVLNNRRIQVWPDRSVARMLEDFLEHCAVLAAYRDKQNRSAAFDEPHPLQPQGKIYCYERMDPKSGEPTFPKSRWRSGHFASFRKLKQDFPKLVIGSVSELSELYPWLTVRENLRFFGRLYGMPESQIQQRIQVLSETLQLPNEHRRTWSLQESELGRVSLAAALLPSPSLLILREPTKTQNHSFKKRIWDHIRTLSREEGVVVMLYTDDSEEAARADDVTQVLNYCYVARVLLNQCPYGTLVGVPGKLRDEKELAMAVHRESPEILSIDTKAGALEVEITKVPINESKMPPGSWSRILMLLMNKLAVHKLILAIPWFMYLLFYSGLIGMDMLGYRSRPSLPVALVRSNATPSLVDPFLASLRIGSSPGIWNDTILRRFYGDLDEARASVERGETCGLMRIGRNFSAAPHYQFLFKYANDEDNATLDSVLDIDVNASSSEVRFMLQRAIIVASEELRRHIQDASNASNIELESRLREPAFGSRLMGLTEFYAPSLFIYTTFLGLMLSQAVEAVTVFMDSRHLPVGRFGYAGVKEQERAISAGLYVTLVPLTQSVIVGLCFCLLKWCDVLSPEGSPAFATLHIAWYGYVGMMLGSAISWFCCLFYYEFRVWCVVYALALPQTLLVIGCFSPSHSVPKILRDIGHDLSPTTSAELVRYYLHNRNPIEKEYVKEAFWGYTVSLGYVLLILTVLFLLIILIRWMRDNLRVVRKTT